MKKILNLIFISFLLLICYKSFNIPTSIDRSIGKLPVMHDGRIKPFDTVSRHYLLQIQGKQSLSGISPTEWLFGIATDSNKFYDLPVILIEHPLLFASVDKKYNKQKFRVSESFLDEHIVIIEPFIKEALQYKKEQRSPFLQAVYLVYYRYQLMKD